jgi:hypothetical protein
MDPLIPGVSTAPPAPMRANSGGGSPSISRFFSGLVALVLIAAFAAFVWPTIWRYDHITIDGDVYPVRIHRVTGHADVLLPGDGWTPAEDVTTDSTDEDQSPQTKS